MSARLFRYFGRPRFEELERTHELCQKAGRQISVLLEDFSVETPEDGILTAPAGMPTDRASIPHLAFFYLAPTDLIINWPSVHHDAGYELQGAIRKDGPPLTRERIDELLRQMMIAAGARPSQARVVYWAVRSGGKRHWKPSIPG